MRRAWRAFWDELAAELELRAATIRTGVTRAESVAIDEFEVQLRMVTRNAAERDDLRNAAIAVGKLGLVEADLEPMARAWYRAKYRETPNA